MNDTTDNAGGEPSPSEHQQLIEAKADLEMARRAIADLEARLAEASDASEATVRRRINERAYDRGLYSGRGWVRHLGYALEHLDHVDERVSTFAEVELDIRDGLRRSIANARVCLVDAVDAQRGVREHELDGPRRRGKFLGLHTYADLYGSIDQVIPFEESDPFVFAVLKVPMDHLGTLRELGDRWAAFSPSVAFITDTGPIAGGQ